MCFLLTTLLPWNECGRQLFSVLTLSELCNLRAQYLELCLDLRCKSNLGRRGCICWQWELPCRKFWKEETAEEELISFLLKYWTVWEEFQPDPGTICPICGLYPEIQE